MKGEAKAFRDSRYRPPIMKVEIKVPIIANVIISTKLLKNSRLFRKYVASYIMTGTKMYRNTSGGNVRYDSIT